MPVPNTYILCDIKIFTYVVFQLLDENFLWVEKVPPEVRANIIASADLNGDGFITQDEFIHLGMESSQNVELCTYIFGKF